MPRPLEDEDDDLGHVLGGHHPGKSVGRPSASLVEREVGGHSAGADIRAANPVLPQLVVEGARQTDLPELRRAVHGLVREPAAARLRCKRDDVALTAQHVRQRCANRVHRSLEVHVEHLVEVLAREVEERPVGADSSVRDDDVDSAEALGGRGAERR